VNGFPDLGFEPHDLPMMMYYVWHDKILAFIVEATSEVVHAEGTLRSLVGVVVEGGWSFPKRAVKPLNPLCVSSRLCNQPHAYPKHNVMR
jgi:hypothetical protein